MPNTSTTALGGRDNVFGKLTVSVISGEVAVCVQVEDTRWLRLGQALISFIDFSQKPKATLSKLLQYF